MRGTGKREQKQREKLTLFGDRRGPARRYCRGTRPPADPCAPARWVGGDIARPPAARPAKGSAGPEAKGGQTQ